VGVRMNRPGFHGRLIKPHLGSSRMPLACGNPATHASAVGCRKQFNVSEYIRPSFLPRVIILKRGGSLLPPASSNRTASNLNSWVNRHCLPIEHLLRGSCPLFGCPSNPGYLIPRCGFLRCGNVFSRRSHCGCFVVGSQLPRQIYTLDTATNGSRRAQVNPVPRTSVRSFEGVPSEGTWNFDPYAYMGCHPWYGVN